MSTTARRVALALVVTLLTLGGPPPARPQGGSELDAIRQELRALREGQAAIRKELERLRGAASAAPDARPAEPESALVTVEGAPFRGDEHATLTLVEFSDFQCPFCARHVRETLPQLDRDYIRTGKLKYVVRDFPLESIHAQALKGHEAARCAGEQGRYWEMHGRLFGSQRALAPGDLAGHGQALGLDAPRFQECLDSGRHAPAIRQDVADGQRVGVTGTPTFFLGYTRPGEPTVRGVKMLRGARPYASFKEAIETLLAARQP
jgi:protein-disulfide isomerase